MSDTDKREAKHTPGPWTVGPYHALHAVDSDVDIGEADGGYLTDPLRDFPDDVSAANAARIVACVNALEGLNPAAVREVISLLRRIGDSPATPGPFRLEIHTALARAEKAELLLETALAAIRYQTKQREKAERSRDEALARAEKAEREAAQRRARKEAGTFE